MKKKGSALIVAMLLIAGVGAVSFGIGRLLFIETTTATLYENGIPAYYAAESGIEEGFLRYKFNRNAEVPISTSAAWSLTGNLVFRETLNYDPALGTQINMGGANGATAPGIDTNSPLASYQKSQQLYHLRMGYLGTPQESGLVRPWMGHDIGNVAYPTVLGADDRLDRMETWHPNYYAGDYAGLRIVKDNSLKIDLSHIDFLTVNRMHAGFSFQKSTTSSWTAQELCQATAELKISVTDASGVKEYKELLSHNPADCGPRLGIDQNKLLLIGPEPLDYSNDNKFVYLYTPNLLDLFARAGDSLPNNPTSVVLTLRPLFYDTTIMLFSVTDGGAHCDDYPAVVHADNPDCVVRGHIPPGPFTYISSKGYYGGVTRKITANIDRQSGTLYDLFDYVIFSEQ